MHTLPLCLLLLSLLSLLPPATAQCTWQLDGDFLRNTSINPGGSPQPACSAPGVWRYLGASLNGASPLPLPKWSDSFGNTSALGAWQGVENAFGYDYPLVVKNFDVSASVSYIATNPMYARTDPASQAHVPQDTRLCAHVHQDPYSHTYNYASAIANSCQRCATRGRSSSSRQFERRRGDVDGALVRHLCLRHHRHTG